MMRIASRPVIPAQAGIHFDFDSSVPGKQMDSGFRRNDGVIE
jgi:hypothetical protein